MHLTYNVKGSLRYLWPPMGRMFTTAPQAFPMTSGCPGLLKGIKRRAKQGLDHELRTRRSPVPRSSRAPAGSRGGPGRAV